MHPNVKDAMESLHPTFERLIGSPAYRLGDIVPSRGVYLFSEQDRPLYVGRSNTLHKRRGQHCKKYSSINSASFATLIARQETGIYRNSKIKVHREHLLENPDFYAAFIRAKLRISEMEFRFIEESDQTRQALLEIYTQRR